MGHSGWKKTTDQNTNSVQDDERELAQIELFGLIQHANGRGAYDAEDKFGNRFELKTTSQKTGVCSSRDAGLRHIERWRNEYWIISTWDAKTEELEESYFLTPDDMEAWISKIESRILERVNLMEKVRCMIQKNVSKDELEIFQRCVERSSVLNGPIIPLKYVKQNGKLINTKTDLKKLVEHYPLKEYTPKQRNTLLNFFV